jgi:hypothetical protein
VSNDNLRTLLTWLDGRKTYIVAAGLVAYVIGGDAGWWPVNESILALFGAAGLGSLRSALKKSPPPPTP